MAFSCGFNYLFLIPLIVGFACNLASAFTNAFSQRWGQRRGTFVTFMLRNVFGIPVWAIGFGLAIHAPSPALFASPGVVEITAWLVIAAGCSIILIALATIRSRAAMPSTRDVLVQNGIYAHVRHPIHSGTFLEFLGLLLLKPTLTVALACILGSVWVFLQTKLEEFDLLQRMPIYREYMNRVPRFLPRFWTR